MKAIGKSITFMSLKHYTLYVVWMNTFVYTIRFGFINWLLIYLLQVKGFIKDQMYIVFLLFKWAV